MQISNYSRIISDVISNKKFGNEMFFWLLLDWFKNEYEDLQLRNRLAHIDVMFYVTKIELRYPEDTKRHHLMLSEMLRGVGVLLLSI